ncbi:putative charged multivesicular body protein 5 [Exidia glandulosa HHB12029]|uniref:Putative charged multivesicular body protein 5 n=1 Tax=Exidia glandulosa HHB12029 TaxID=1314781 RepID=A0A165R127_EXIGL|nr:putative charged multivesicular body protein 5 [Exidia glandulosa HHB12029]
MNRIFGSSKPKPKASLSDAITSTETRIGAIEVKIKKLDAELVKFREQMAKLRNGPGKTAVEQRALRVLKQKRMYEAQLTQLTQQTFNMESAAIATENLRNTMATLDAMKVANKEMQRQYGKIDIDKIESMHMDMEDLLEQANEVQESLGRSYAVPDEIDEADLQAELDALQLEEEEEPSYLADINRVPDFVDEAPLEEVRIRSPVHSRL